MQPDSNFIRPQTGKSSANAGPAPPLAPDRWLTEDAAQVRASRVVLFERKKPTHVRQLSQRTRVGAVQARPRLDSAWFQMFKHMKINSLSS